MSRNDGHKGKVIDLTERISHPEFKDYLRGLKVRFDFEQKKIAVSASLLSILILVTIANASLIATGSSVDQNSLATRGSRGIASVSMSSTLSSTSPELIIENKRLIKELSGRDLGPSASFGQKPSAVEKLAFEYLEGRYSVRMKNGALHEILLTDGAPEQGKIIGNLSGFIASQRALLPTFDRLIKVGAEKEEGGTVIETFQLVNRVSMPVANVQVRMSQDRLVAMTVSGLESRAK